MPVTTCDTCGGDYRWNWEEAFDKFGFKDGDGQVETWQVEAVLTEAGYECIVEGWGLHNTVISSIRKDGTEFVPQDDDEVAFGYDCPRTYLPEDIIALLDEKLA